MQTKLKGAQDAGYLQTIKDKSESIMVTRDETDMAFLAASIIWCTSLLVIIRADIKSGLVLNTGLLSKQVWQFSDALYAMSV